MAEGEKGEEENSKNVEEGFVAKGEISKKVPKYFAEYNENEKAGDAL